MTQTFGNWKTDSSFYESEPNQNIQLQTDFRRDRLQKSKTARIGNSGFT